MFGAIDSSASGMAAMKKWMEVSSNNITNMNTTREVDGVLYNRQTVIFQPKNDFQSRLDEKLGRGVQIESIVEDEHRRVVYEPEHPDANEEGYVSYPEINLATEISNIMVAQNSYAANLSTFNENKKILEKELQIGKY